MQKSKWKKPVVSAWSLKELREASVARIPEQKGKWNEKGFEECSGNIMQIVVCMLSAVGK